MQNARIIRKAGSRQALPPRNAGTRHPPAPDTRRHHLQGKADLIRRSADFHRKIVDIPAAGWYSNRVTKEEVIRFSPFRLKLIG